MAFLYSREFISQFVQSESCKMLCGESDVHTFGFCPYERDEINSIADSVQEAEGLLERCDTPMRSCGCKAQRVLNRFDVRQEEDEDYCTTWYYQIILAKEEHIFPDSDLQFNQTIKAVCYHCRFLPAYLREVSEVVYEVEGHDTDDMPMDASVYHYKYMTRSRCNAINRAPAGIPWVQNMEPYSGPELVGEICNYCSCSIQNVINRKECADCYMNRPYTEPEFEWDRRPLMTPPPCIDLRSPLVSPDEPDSQPSDDEQSDLIEYMYSHGYF